MLLVLPQQRQGRFLAAKVRKNRIFNTQNAEVRRGRKEGKTRKGAPCIAENPIFLSLYFFGFPLRTSASSVLKRVPRLLLTFHAPNGRVHKTSQTTK
jgi:hypothetical protein